MRTRHPFWRAGPHWAKRSARMPRVFQIRRTTSAATLSCKPKRTMRQRNCSAGITHIFKCQVHGWKFSKLCRCRRCDPNADNLATGAESVACFGAPKAGQRDNRSDTGHQAPAHFIVPDDGQQAAMQDAELLANDPPDDEQRFYQHGHIGKVRDELPDTRLKLNRPHYAHLKAEVAQ